MLVYFKSLIFRCHCGIAVKRRFSDSFIRFGQTCCTESICFLFITNSVALMETLSGNTMAVRIKAERLMRRKQILLHNLIVFHGLLQEVWAPLFMYSQEAVFCRLNSSTCMGIFMIGALPFTLQVY